jgi:polyphosphate kinase 2 (PPK2 family)
MAGYHAAFSTSASRATIMIRKDIIELFRVPPGKKIRLRDYDTGWAQSKELKELGKDVIKDRARIILEKNLEALTEAQERLWADDRYAVLVVLQALDAAGKDGTIKHVMSGVNPQGCQVFSFKKPSAEDLDHNFLWRYMRCLPEHGRRSKMLSASRVRSGPPGTSSRPTTSGPPGPSSPTS